MAARWPQLLLAAALLANACATTLPARTTRTVLDGRLPLSSELRPTHYRLHLDLDPERDTFTGHLVLLLESDAPRQQLTLHAEGLRVTHAVARQGDEPVVAEVREAARGALVVSFAQVLESGPFELELTYTGRVADDLHGLYRSKTHERHALLTHFAPDYARRVFPAFDQPGFKARFELILRTPRDVFAVASVGLITSQPWILLIEDDDLRIYQRRALWVVAHELAHQWFGNLVTMTWWHDVWLHESLATWMANDVIHALYPELDLWQRLVERVDTTMLADASPDAWPLVPARVESRDDIERAYGLQAYHKGAAILAQLEQWMGRPAFRAALLDFLGKHAGGHATTEDLLQAFEAHTPLPIRGPLEGQLYSAGVPWLEIDWSCPRDDLTEITITRHHLGADTERPDRLPMCMAELHKGSWNPFCFVDSIPSTSPVLIDHCIEALHPNFEHVGYYRWSLSHHALSALAPHMDSEGWSWWFVHQRALLDSGFVGVEALLRHADAAMLHIESSLLFFEELRRATRTSPEMDALWNRWSVVHGLEPRASVHLELRLLDLVPPGLISPRVLLQLSRAAVDDVRVSHRLLLWFRDEGETWMAMRLARIMGIDLIQHSFSGLCSSEDLALLVELVGEDLDAEYALENIQPQILRCTALRQHQPQVEATLRELFQD